MDGNYSNTTSGTVEAITNAKIVKADRGTVKRITFELLYPNGQLKQVVVENNSEQELRNVQSGRPRPARSRQLRPAEC